MFFDILVGYEVKIEIWGDYSGCERCGYFWSDFGRKIRQQIVSLMSCGWVISYQILFCILYLIGSLSDYILQVDYLP